MYATLFNRAYANLFPRDWRRHYRKPYHFTGDFFTSRIPIWKRLLEPLRGVDGLRALEVGTYEGRSAMWLLENILTSPSSHLTCVDLYYALERAEACFLWNVNLSGAQERVSLKKELSTVALSTLHPQSFDLIYLDGDHEAQAIEKDARLAWPLLKSNGILIIDDLKWPEALPGKEPALGVDLFLRSIEGKYKLLYQDQQLIVSKNSAPTASHPTNYTY